VREDTNVLRDGMSGLQHPVVVKYDRTVIRFKDHLCAFVWLLIYNAKKFC